jgi:hypothetical protein
MLKHAAFFLSTILLMVAIFIAGEYALSPMYNQCVAKDQQSNSNSSDEKNPPGLRVIITSYAHCTGDFIDKNDKVLIVIATFVIAAFTGTLWVATSRQAELTARSVKVAELALTQLEAPFIGLKITESGIAAIWRAKDRCEIRQTWNALTFCFVNYGRTPAVLLGLDNNLQICAKEELPSLDGMLKVSYPYGVLMGPDKESTDSTCLFEDFFDESEFKKFSEGDSNLFLVGRLKYRDIFNGTFEMGFCAVFNREGSRFLMEGDQKYNYCRRL